MTTPDGEPGAQTRVTPAGPRAVAFDPSGDERRIGMAIEPTPARRPLSRLMQDLGQHEGDRITLGEIVASLSDRSFAALLLILAAPNLIAVIPGSSLVLGMPLIVIASQLLLGRPRLWLPRVLNERSVERAALAALAARLAPRLSRFERLARPRYWTQPPVIAERIAGAVALVMAILVALPVPFGNTVPALAIIVIAISLTERDGIWLALGCLVAVAGLGMVVGFLAAVGFAVEAASG